MSADEFLQSPHFERDRHGIVNLGVARTRDGIQRGFRTNVQIVDDGIASVNAALFVGDKDRLEVVARLATKPGWADLRASALGPVEYEVRLQGEARPVAVAQINQKRFEIEILAPEGVPADLSLDLYLDPETRFALEPIGRLLDMASSEFHPDEEGDLGPGAWFDTPRDWVTAWPRKRHQCWGLAGAASSLICVAGTAAGTALGGLVGGFVGAGIGCSVGGYVFGCLASVCSEHFAKK